MNYIVIDLEMCNVPRREKKNFNCKNEIIQIGAVMLDEEYNEIGTFNSYVRPVFGELDDFITKLTGISDKMLRKAPKLPEVLTMLYDWIDGREYKFFAWSEADYLQMSRECTKKGIHRREIPEEQEAMDRFLLKENWIDYQKVYCTRSNQEHCIGLGDAVESAELKFEGHAHDGLTDARNTAALIRKLELNPGYVPKPVPAKKQIEMTSEPLCFDLGGLFAGIRLDGQAAPKTA